MRLLLAVFSLFLLLQSSVVFGQQNDPVVLPYGDFLDQLQLNHPQNLRAALLRSEAAATELAARGGFDPTLYGDYDDKYFEGTDYWDIGEGGIKAPSLGGLEFSGGYRWADGTYLNQEFTLPSRGQAFAGVKANLLQGLITDERRTALRRAQLLGEWNEVEIAAIRNELGFNATLAYLGWAYAQTQIDILTEGIQLAEDRLVQTRQSYVAGDKPALDTLETFIILQQRQADYNAARADLLYNRTLVNQFYWTDNVRLANLNNGIRPEQLENVVTYPAFGVVGNIAANPSLIAYDFKLRDLGLERRLKSQKLLPKLSLKYEFLAEGFDFTPGAGTETGIGDFVLNDNKWTVNFSVPLLLRSARGELQLNAVKQQRTQLDRTQKEGELELKLQQYDGQTNLIREQLRITRTMVDNYATLLAAERIKFNLGESSVFLLNSRENKLLEARLKLAKLEADLAKALAGRRYVVGGF